MKNYILTFENNRTCTIECEETGQPLQDKINAAEQRFNSPVVKINDKEVKEHSLGGFLLGAVIGSVLGNSVAKSGVKKTASKIGSRTKKAVGNAKKDISEFRKASSKKFSNGGGVGKDKLNLKILEGHWHSYYKGVNGGQKDDGYVTIKNENDLQDYIKSKLGDVIKSIELLEKGKRYPYNRDNPYSHDFYLITLKNGQKFNLERQYGVPNWSGNVDYVERISISENKKFSNGGILSNNEIADNMDQNELMVTFAKEVRNYPTQVDYNVLEKILPDYVAGKDITYVLTKRDTFTNGGGVDELIEFSDGFTFKKVSKEYAEKNFENEEIFGINVSEETEALIESKDDLDAFETFGIEMGFKDTFAHGGQIPDVIETLVLEENENVSDSKKMKRKVYENIFSFLPEIKINEIGDISNRYGRNNQELKRALREFISKTPYEVKRNYYDSLNPGDILIYDNISGSRNADVIMVSVGTNPEFVYGWSKFFPGWIQVDINKIFVPEYAKEMGFTLSNLREKPKGTDFEGNYLYSDGGLVGKHAIFDRFGEQKMGIITEDLGDGRLIVISGMGQYAVTPDNLISITEPVEKKGFFSFGKGGSVYNRSWHQDHNRYNKAESYEIPMSERSKKFAGGGGVEILYSGSELNRRFELSKQEILADVKSGKVPKSVNSFSDLQNYVDANCYGGLCDNDYKISKDYSFENKLQVKLNHWIEQGGIKVDNLENYEFGNGGYLVQYGPGNKKTIISTKSEADDFVKTLKEKGHTNIKVRSKSEYKKQYESTSEDIKMDLQKRFNINPNSYSLILSEKGKWKISPVNIKDWMNNYGSIQTVEQEINKQYKKFSGGGGVGNITEKELLDWAKGIDDENLLSWCGYSNKGDFEDSADLPYSKKNLVETNFEDLEYVYNNQNEYGIKYNNGGGVGDTIRIKGFPPISKQVAILMNEDFEENFNSNIERYTKHLNSVHNSKLKVIDVKEVIDFSKKYSGGGGVPSIKKYRLLSPDGFDIKMDALYSEEELMPAFEQFKKRYEKQGYYSTGNRERIDLRDLEDYMSVVEVENYEDYE
jgi:hypothetical protein